MPEPWDLDDSEVVYPSWAETMKWFDRQCPTCRRPLRPMTAVERALAEALCEGTHLMVRPGTSICNCL